MAKAASYRNICMLPSRVHSRLRLLLFRGVIFLCLFNIANTVISLPVLQQLRNAASLQLSPGNNLDSSLLELMMENYQEVPESPVPPAEEVEEVLTEVEYLLNTYSFYFRLPGTGETTCFSVAQSAFVNPHMDGVTPPPKQV